MIFGAIIAQRVARSFAYLRPPPLAELFPELTEREREILGLVAEHLSNADIAACLTLSEKTVRNHVSSVSGKLQLTDRV